MVHVGTSPAKKENILFEFGNHAIQDTDFKALKNKGGLTAEVLEYGLQIHHLVYWKKCSCLGLSDDKSGLALKIVAAVSKAARKTRPEEPTIPSSFPSGLLLKSTDYEYVKDVRYRKCVSLVLCNSNCIIK